MACKYKSKVWENGWCNVACSYCTLTQESTCKHNKQTNADRIRAMSDEELANFLEEASWICANQVCRKCPLSTGTENCKSLKEWLKQPAGE